VVGDDRNGIVEPHNLTHALHRLGCGIVHAFHASTEHGRLHKGRDLHARRPGVDPEGGRPIDLCRRVQALGRFADELEFLRPLERHVLRHGHAGCVGSE
jgi:hypothetical protein